MLNVYEQIERNKLKSLIIIVLFFVFITIVLWVFFQLLGLGSAGIILALIIAFLSSFSSYYWSDKIILAISQARQADKKRDFNFFTAVENLCLTAQLPMPKLYIIEDTAMNAFTTGRDPNHAVICATTGLLSRLTKSEIEAVVGHEISHIKNYDMRLMTVVVIMVGLITLLADWFLRGSSFFNIRKRDREKNTQIHLFFLVLAVVLVLLSPFIANLIKLAISRRREFLADAGSAMLTRNPNSLITALKKLSADKEPLEAANKATAHLFIINPLKNLHKGVGWFSSLFNTHPPIEARIQALERML